MIVVADTSVILNLCRVQHEHLLKRLFQRVLIPVQVAEEFKQLVKSQPRFSGLVLPEWIEIFPVTDPAPNQVISADLDLGESAAIILCLKHNADAF